jgi:hypothetical protein
VTQPTASGFLTVFPAGLRGIGAQPATSNLDFGSGQTVAVQVTVGGVGQANIFNGSGGTVQIVADQQGGYVFGPQT